MTENKGVVYLKTGRPLQHQGYYNPWEYLSGTSLDRSRDIIYKPPSFWHKSRKWLCRRSIVGCILLIIWFLCFYTGALILWIICWCVFYHGLRSPTEPYYTTLLTTLTGRGPVTKSIVMYPNSSHDHREHECRYILDESKNPKLKEIFDEYKKGGGVECSYQEKKSKDSVCKFDIANFGPCAQLGTMPCLFVKITKVHGWIPEAYPRDKTPPKFPKYIDEYRDELPPGSLELNTTWLGCEGKDKNDRKKITAMTYYPLFGFPNYYYPYLGQKDYQNPMVAVQLHGIKENQKVKVICRIYAANVDIDDEEEMGSRWIEFSYHQTESDSAVQHLSAISNICIYTVVLYSQQFFLLLR